MLLANMNLECFDHPFGLIAEPTVNLYAAACLNRPVPYTVVRKVRQLNQLAQAARRRERWAYSDRPEK